MNPCGRASEWWWYGMGEDVTWIGGSGICRGIGWVLRRCSIVSLGLPVAWAICGVVPSDTAAAEGAGTKTTVGRLERVWIEEADVIFDAKIDTGTLTASLNVRNVDIFSKDREVWARFIIDDPDGKPIALERLVLRFARFKKQGHEVDRRPVVVLGLCVGDIYRRTEVNLTDRKRFSYPILIGRRFLSGKAVVDTEKTYTGPPRCKEMNKK
jgi:hypothetical protein